MHHHPSPRSACGHGSRRTDRRQGGASASRVCRGHRVSRPPTPLPRRWTDPCGRARDGGPRRAAPVADSAADADCAERASSRRGGEVESHDPEQGVKESFGLAQRKMGEESQGHGGFDGKIRVPPLPTPPAAPAGRPGSDRFRGHPHRHIAAANEGPIVGRPIRHAIFRLVYGMNLRLHPCSVAPAETKRASQTAPPVEGLCRVAPEDCSPEALTRAGLGGFHHPALPLMWLMAMRPRFARESEAQAEGIVPTTQRTSAR